MSKKSFRLLLQVLLIPLFFFGPILLFPKSTFALITSYKITDSIPPEPIAPPTNIFSVYFTKSFTLNYTSGDVLLSSTPDGLGDIAIDDGYTMTITNPNGIKRFFGGLFENNCDFITPKPPQNLKNVLGVGTNQILVELKDFCGGFKSSTALYLTYNDPTLPPPTPSPTPTTIPTPTPTPLPTPSPKTPLIFIPGIGGSELQTTNQILWDHDDGHGGTYTHLYPENDKVWINTNEAIKPGDDDYFDILKMNSDGITSDANLEPTGQLFEGTYGEALNFFSNKGYTINSDFFTFAYDWRKDITLTTSKLDQKINEILTKTHAQKVDIIAHSMGGLVARNYIKDQNNANKIRKLIELGVPHLGATKFLKSLLYGDCLTREELQNLPICLGLSTLEIKDILQNMATGFELAPTQKYFDFYTGGSIYPKPFTDIRDVDQNGITGELNYLQTKTLLTNLGSNTNLFTPAEILHQIDNNYKILNGIQTLVISGTGYPTIGQIVEKNSFDMFNIKIPKKDLLMINGDETVPLFSSSLTDPDRNLFEAGTQNIFYTKQTHGGLVENGPALNLAYNFLSNITEIPEGVKTQPFTLKGQQISVHSPVNLDIYDQKGNHTGLNNGNIEEKIPGSSYYTIDDAKFIWLPEGGIYNIKINAISEGNFDLKIKTFENNSNIKSIIYNQIPVNPSTKAQVILDTQSAHPPTLQIDEDGNGNTDDEVTPFSILSGEANYDEIPPEINVNEPKEDNILILNQPKQAEYFCTDNGGSELKTCAGTTPNGDNIDTQSVGQKNFIIKAFDNSGNQTLKKVNYYVQYSNESCAGEPGHKILQPINSDGSSVFKQGSTITVKFRVCDSYGISIFDQKMIKNFNLVKIVSPVSLTNIKEAVNSTTPESNFRFDQTNKQWIFNMNTKTLQVGRTYFYVIELNDDTKINFSFSLR